MNLFQRALSRLTGLFSYKEDALRMAGTFRVPPYAPTYPRDEKKPLQGIVNNQYWRLTRGNMDYYFNPDSIGVEVYEEMVDSDETCYAAIEFLILATLAKFGAYRHENQEIESFVNSCLEQLETPWLDVLKEQLTAVWAGYSVTEIIAEYDGEFVRPTQLQTIHPSELTFELHLDGPRKNLVKAIRQNRWNTAGAYIPAEKAVIFTHNKQFGNAYGKSRLRTTWRSWFLKTKMMAAWALVLDRYGSPHAVATVKNGFEEEVHPETGEKISILPLVTEQLNKLARDGSVAVTEAIQIELHQAKQAVGADFSAIIEYLDKNIFRGALVPSLVGDHGSNGSYALGSRHYDLFVLMLEENAQQLANCNLQQFVKPLIQWNFGPQNDYGGFVLEDFKQDDELLLSQAFKNMVETGHVNPKYAPDRNTMRERTGFAPMTQEEIDKLPEFNPPKGGTPTSSIESTSREKKSASIDPSAFYRKQLTNKIRRPGALRSK